MNVKNVAEEEAPLLTSRYHEEAFVRDEVIVKDQDEMVLEIVAEEVTVGKRSVKPNASWHPAQDRVAQAISQPLVQGSPEWIARLWKLGDVFPGAKPLSQEATSREAFYGEDLR